MQQVVFGKHLFYDVQHDLLVFCVIVLACRHIDFIFRELFDFSEQFCNQVFLVLPCDVVLGPKDFQGLVVLNLPDYEVVHELGVRVQVFFRRVVFLLQPLHLFHAVKGDFGQQGKEPEKEFVVSLDCLYEVRLIKAHFRLWIGVIGI